MQIVLSIFKIEFYDENLSQELLNRAIIGVILTIFYLVILVS